MQALVLGGFVVSGVAPWLHRLMGGRAALLLALWPAAILAWLLGQWSGVVAGEALVSEWAWMPALDVSLTFRLDGLALLFALLIVGIGGLVLVYAGGYLRGHSQLPRFLVLFLVFMTAMLGLVLADNLVALFVFWELTGLSSYLLIGFRHTDPLARQAARQALLITTGGGLALLVGLILLAQAGDSWSLATLVTRGDTLRAHPLYPCLLAGILLGAFTKSAQFPFQFWLPNAMVAPTPVSAYLHSATLVKAGIYLMARLHPALGGSVAWTLTLVLVGGVTLVLGAVMALRQTNLKLMLAHSTVMALGVMTLLLGVGTRTALTACLVFLVAHAFYKGALFLVAGILDVSTGTLDITAMGGLRHALPGTALVAALAALSLAGLPPTLGFVAKEQVWATLLTSDPWGGVALAALVPAAGLMVAVAAIVAVRPFFGPPVATPRAPRSRPSSLLLGAAPLATLSLLAGLGPGVLDGLLSAALSAIGAPGEAPHLALWHGFGWPLALSLGGLLLGWLAFRHWDRLRGWLEVGLAPWVARGPEVWHAALGWRTLQLAEWQTRWLQNGHLRSYLAIILMSWIGLVGQALVVHHGLPGWPSSGIQAFEGMVAGLMAVAAVTACLVRSRLAAVAALGSMGFAIALTFVLFSAPDLAITQLLVETLTVVLLALVLFRLPHFTRLSSFRQRWRDLGIAGLAGGLVTALMLAVLDGERLPRISDWMVSQGQPLGHGRNLVNVILVDIRALDTLGEVFVLALAATGVYAMLCLRAEESSWSSPAP
ncbi:hydrogen gas-evolving membrane-bound hydrogenase subunit E [Halomonas organivorans]|uniref:Multicomponent Na+:H+ antiporter subunit A n=1 Tax=Halomonas organivorans TaxID=257772 RepID=A0A7W5G7X0_9GAMM|nr:hydrogen gas-evolving membrane-bound hydrogenase subunit E [Halomonas organivorans]MBB3142986.1 multicomponent Na+:H+ antiporter subunit A [Halomonas organivorans]